MSDIINDLVKVSGKNSTEVTQAWDFAKNQAKQKYNPNDEEYYPYAVELVKGMLGGLDQMEKPTEDQTMFDTEDKSMFDNSLFGEHIEVALDVLSEDTNLSETLNKLIDGTFIKSYEEAIQFYLMVEAKNTEPFEWILTSNQTCAKAYVVYKKQSYSVQFDYIKPGTTYWLPQWNPLRNKNIDQIVKMTLGQLDSDGNKIKNTVISRSSLYAGDDALAKLLVKVVRSYLKIWGKSKFQILYYTDDATQKTSLIKKIAKEINSARMGLKLDDGLSATFSELHYVGRPLDYYVFVNSGGKKIKEGNISEEDGTCMSSDFGDAIPADAGHNWKHDGNDLNKQAIDSLKAMGMRENMDDVENYAIYDDLTEEDYIPLATQICDDLGHQSDTKIGLVPMGFATEDGMFAFKAIVGTSGYAITLEFSDGDLARIGQLENPGSDHVVKHIDLNGYPAESVMSELGKQIIALCHTGKFIDSMPVVKEARTANDSFNAWAKHVGKDKVSKMLTSDKIKSVYTSSYTPWAKDNNIEPTTYVTFYNKANDWLNTNNLQNTYARKTLVINTDGTVKMVDAPDEEKSWKTLLTDTYKIPFNHLHMAVRNVVLGATNAVYISGDAGVGKTTHVRAELEAQNVGYYWVSGLINDKESLIKILYDHRDNDILVFDDTKLLKDKAFREILLCVMDDKEVRNVSYFERKNMNRQVRNKVESQFEFTSGVIVIGNDPPNKIDVAIKSRCPIVPISLDKNQMMSLIYDNLKTFLPDIPMEIKEYVFDWLLKNLGDFRRIDYRMMKTATANLLGCRHAGDNSNNWEIYTRSSLGLN